jgi:hypothetical protein
MHTAPDDRSSLLFIAENTFPCYTVSAIYELMNLPSPMPSHRFGPSYLEAVHGGLDKILGESGTASVLFYIKAVDEFPDPAEFDKKLTAIFGPRGALSLERAIVKDLALRLKWSLDLMKIEGTFDFKATMIAIENGVRA